MWIDEQDHRLHVELTRPFDHEIYHIIMNRLSESRRNPEGRDAELGYDITEEGEVWGIHFDI